MTYQDIPKPAGQLWEECRRCGEEPIYMPLDLCASCWPKKPKPVEPGPRVRIVTTRRKK